MKFSVFIAKRYLFSKKSHNIINIISSISLVGVFIGTAALIIVLSVFNGFESLVMSLFSTFNPEIKITAKEGKVFNAFDVSKEEICKIPGVIHYIEVLEENALLKYDDKQYLSIIKGVDEGYFAMSGIDTMLVNGKALLQSGSTDYAIPGMGVAWHLGVNVNDRLKSMAVFMPERGGKVHLDPSKAFRKERILPIAIYSVQQEIDDKYVVVPLRFVRKLLDYTDEVSVIELGLEPSANVDEIKNEISKIVGEEYCVKDRFQQEEVLYKVMRSEKMSIFIILTFILIIATFNVIGSMAILILDKRKDIGILKSLGADNHMIRTVFFIEGLMITIIGAFLGLVFGGLICFMQKQFGLVKLHTDGSFVINNYPVDMQIADFVWVFLIVFVIGCLAAYLPARQINNRTMQIKDLIS